MLDCERLAFDFQFHEQKTLRWKTMTLCLMILHHDPSYTRIPIPILPLFPVLTKPAQSIARSQHYLIKVLPFDHKRIGQFLL